MDLRDCDRAYLEIGRRYNGSQSRILNEQPGYTNIHKSFSRAQNYKRLLSETLSNTGDYLQVAYGIAIEKSKIFVSYCCAKIQICAIWILAALVRAGRCIKAHLPKTSEDWVDLLHACFLIFGIIRDIVITYSLCCSKKKRVTVINTNPWFARRPRHTTLIDNSVHHHYNSWFW